MDKMHKRRICACLIRKRVDMTMNQDNRELADLMRKEFAGLQTDRLIKIESERRLEQRFCAGRQRIREVIGQLVSEGLLIKYEGKGTYIAPFVKNKYMNLICSPDIKFSDPFYNRLLMELTNYAAKNSVNMIPLTLETLKNGDMISPVLMIGKFEEPDLEKIKDAIQGLYPLKIIRIRMNLPRSILTISGSG